MNATCNLCKGNTETIEPTKEKVWVTTNGYVLNASVHLHTCSECGHVQKYIDDEYNNKFKDIFKYYEVNLFSSNIDQMSFQSDGNFSSRLGSIVDKIKYKNILKKTGSLLEVGCARGFFLKAFHKEFPAWDLYGQEYNDIFKDIIFKIDGVKDFYERDDIITTSMNCIAMNHVLEIVPFPTETLLIHHNLLEDSGVHFVQVPDFLKDPFDLCIIDQVSHFTRSSLNYLAKKCGYSIISTTDGWTQKHTGWLATKCAPQLDVQMDVGTIEAAKNNVLNIMKWLNELPSFILEYSKGKELGIFGTAPASSWIAGAIDEQNTFFVDEDPYRQGKKLMDKIIYAPIDCPKNSCVFLPFAPQLAKIIQERLSKKYPQVDFFYFNSKLF